MKKNKRKSRLRITGNARGLMQICKDIRRRWLQYGENRKTVSLDRPDSLGFRCPACNSYWTFSKLQIDHIVPLGPRPRTWEELGPYAKKMFERKCQALCKSCHQEKTKAERERRKSNGK